MDIVRNVLCTLALLLVSHSALAANPNTDNINNSANFEQVVTQIKATGDKLIADYDPSNGMATMDGFSSLYFEQYEGSGMELAVTAMSPTMNRKTESLFTQLIGFSSEGAAKSQLEKTWHILKIRLNGDLNLLITHHASTFGQVLLQSFIILVREGFEALLIVTALLTYLRRSGHGNKTYAIYYGVGAALIASFITAYLFNRIFHIAGANREALEGITMLIAAGVLFYVSYWLFAKRESDRWQTYIRHKMTKAITTGSLFALGLAAFLAVYREGAETILFYQALAIGNSAHIMAIFSGIFCACLALVLIYFAMRSATVKIPYRFFFGATAIFLYYMAFYFIGGGMLELQEAGWISITPITWLPQIGWLGIYPTWQSLGTQLLFLVPTLAGVLWWRKQQAKARLNAQTAA